MTSQVNNPGDVRCDSVALDANQMADKLMALQIEPAEGPEDAQLPKDRTSGFGTNGKSLSFSRLSPSASRIRFR